MPIPNVWKEKKAKGGCRALYNIALNRLAPTNQPISRQLIRVSAGADRTPGLWDLRASTTDRRHWMALSPRMCRDLREAQAARPNEHCGVLAMWRQDEANPANTIHCWWIPESVVHEIDRVLNEQFEQATPEERERKSLRNLNIVQVDGRWHWRRPNGNPSIDIHDYYRPWNDLTAEELEHIRAGLEGLLDASENLDGDEGEDTEDTVPENVVRGKAGPVACCRYPVNRIYFGPPGSGKSRRAQDFLGTLGTDLLQTVRVTFHPEYTYSDFTGTYKPVMAWHGNDQYRAGESEEGEALPAGRPAVVYQFVPGPFIRALTEALLSPRQLVALVIEEINRGNCAAIFGDVFQLLDRQHAPGEWLGSSQYPVQPDPMLARHVWARVPANTAAGRRLREEGLFIPANLLLLATMNTSDQSLFPMDSAFKRRWDLTYVAIQYADADKRLVSLTGGEARIEVSWARFLTEINRRIAAVMTGDDKQIGPWFIAIDQDIRAEMFRDKVLSYLWADVFRNEPAAVFDERVQTYDDLVRRYEEGKWVFTRELAEALGVAAEVGFEPARADGETVNVARPLTLH